MAPEMIDGLPAPEWTACHKNNFQPCQRKECPQFRVIYGTDKNTNEEIARWDCMEVASNQIMDVERNAYLREMIAVMETMRAEHYLQMETVLVMMGRRDILESYRARRDHVRALNRTDELLAERAGNVIPKALAR